MHGIDAVTENSTLEDGRRGTATEGNWMFHSRAIVVMVQRVVTSEAVRTVEIK